MLRFAAITALVVGLAMTPAIVRANPIGVNGCGAGALGYVCDIFVDDVTGVSTLDATGLAPGWLVGYTFLLNVGANLSDGIQDIDVAHALVIHSSIISLFTPAPGAGSLSFSTIVANALALVPIDSMPLSGGQIVGYPTVGGVMQLNGVGLFNTADTVAMLSQIAWGSGPTAIGGYDSLTVHTGLANSSPPSGVDTPEPSALSLLALGACAAALLRRRARKTV